MPLHLADTAGTIELPAATDGVLHPDRFQSFYVEGRTRADVKALSDPYRGEGQSYVVFVFKGSRNCCWKTVALADASGSPIPTSGDRLACYSQE
ncbi:MAG: hypothetical protein EXS09_06270 [Gemmataceae bacterium]|nr:hypothetical protein [Gemmataceae bacterium]